MIEEIFQFSVIVSAWWLINRIILPKLGVPT